jgi:hypothetical protein
MRETRTYGSARGAAGNSRSYRKPGPEPVVGGAAVSQRTQSVGPKRSIDGPGVPAPSKVTLKSLCAWISEFAVTPKSRSEKTMNRCAITFMESPFSRRRLQAEAPIRIDTS